MYAARRKMKGNQQSLNEVQKIEAITRVQNGETKAAVARQFGIPESTLRGWCKKAKIQESNNNRNHNHNHLKQTTLTPVAAVQLKTPTPMPMPMYGDYNNYYDYYTKNSFLNIKLMEKKEEVGENSGSDSPLSSHNSSSSSSNGTQRVTSSTGFYTPKIKRGCFYEWCKNTNNKNELASIFGEVCSTTLEMDNKPLNLITPGNRRRLENLLNGERVKNEDENEEEIITVEDALKHGEMFLKFLRQCSDPNISVLQAIQFAVLVNSLRSSVERKL